MLKNKHINPLARVGMRVELFLDNWGPHFGSIINILPDACIVRLDKSRDTSDGDAPDVAAIAWENVCLIDVQPDLPASKAGHPDPFVFTIGPGTRVRIDVGDGNDDKHGTIFHCLPECGVVKLDETLKYGGHRYVAADWHLITTIPLVDEDAADEEVTDAMDLAQAVESTDKPAAPKCVIRPGMRVEITIGDGNDDVAGTVVHTLPECCVVELDTPLEQGGSRHAACDWHLVTPLNLAPEPEGGAQ